MYCNAETTCPEAPAGYSWLPQQDYAGNDITCGPLGSRTPQELATECSRMGDVMQCDGSGCSPVPRCKGFNIYRHVQWGDTIVNVRAPCIRIRSWHREPLRYSVEPCQHHTGPAAGTTNSSSLDPPTLA